MSDKAATTRITLLERDQVSPEIAAVYDALLKQRGVVPNMFKTLAHTPGLALGIAGFLKSLLSDGALLGWYKELVATRLSALLGSSYAIAGHSLSARQKGRAKPRSRRRRRTSSLGRSPSRKSWGSGVPSGCISRRKNWMTRSLLN